MMIHSKQRAFIYPSPIMKGDMVNPYIQNFVNSLEENFDFLNKHYPSNSKGIFDILRFIGKLDILFLNWPEEVPNRKGGVIQAFFLVIIMYYLKLKKVRIFWTFHNKESHVKTHMVLKNFLRRFTAQKSDFILTHAREGVTIVEKLANPATPKIIFMHHPVSTPIEINYNKKKLYDIVLWGTVAPYKGVEQFLDFVKSTEFDHLRILIAGKITDIHLRDKILPYQNSEITIMNRFISDSELESFISQSRAVLFTYLEFSILSSGALMDTLRYAPLIIGPHFGAFKDLEEEGLILTYENYGQLRDILKDHLMEKPNTGKISSFIMQNSWTHFGNEINRLLVQDLN